MRVFLSWSGETSLKVASALRDWLPSVIQSVKPYLSAEDINKGARWSADVAKELEAAAYGIICLTPDNLTAPWIHFEAGALSKTLDKSYVTSFLFNVLRSSVEGPLVQFQSVLNDQQDIFKMVASINATADAEQRLDTAVLKKTFELWWPHLEAVLKQILSEMSKATVVEERRDPAEILEELLELARKQESVVTTGLMESNRAILETMTTMWRELSYLRAVGDNRAAAKTLFEPSPLHKVDFSAILQAEPRAGALRRAARTAGLPAAGKPVNPFKAQPDDATLEVDETGGE